MEETKRTTLNDSYLASATFLKDKAIELVIKDSEYNDENIKDFIKYAEQIAQTDTAINIRIKAILNEYRKTIEDINKAYEEWNKESIASGMTYKSKCAEAISKLQKTLSIPIEFCYKFAEQRGKFLVDILKKINEKNQKSPQDIIDIMNAFLKGKAPINLSYKNDYVQSVFNAGLKFDREYSLYTLLIAGYEMQRAAEIEEQIQKFNNGDISQEELTSLNDQINSKYQKLIDSVEKSKPSRMEDKDKEKELDGTEPGQ